MKESPIEYVGRTMMNLFLTFGNDPEFKATTEESGMEITMQALLEPIVDSGGPAGARMVSWYRKLSNQFDLDKVNDDNFDGSWNSLRWQDEESMEGPNCGSCGNQTTAILYGMPGEDFDFEKFESGGCIVCDSDPVWVCRKCGWQI